MFMPAVSPAGVLHGVLSLGKSTLSIEEAPTAVLGIVWFGGVHGLSFPAGEDG